jgi:hypothetical protein
MTKLTTKQERSLSKMNPEAAARRRKTMEAERVIVMTSRHDDAAIAAGMDDLILNPIRRALRAALGK